MRTTISFVDKNENFLLTINHDVNPIDTYKVGDKIYLEVDTIVWPKTKEQLRLKFKEEFVKHILEQHEIDCDRLNKRFKIVSKYHTIKTSINFEDQISQTIEYTVKPCEKFYFKWWHIKYLLKKLLRDLKIVK